MSDDLVRRLREGATWDDDIAAADRIEQLAAINEELEAKLSKSEALLAKAVQALTELVKDCEAEYPPSHGAIKYFCRTTLAELKGDKT